MSKNDRGKVAIQKQKPVKKVSRMNATENGSKKKKTTRFLLPEGIISLKNLNIFKIIRKPDEVIP